MKTGRPAPMAAAPRRITADGGAGRHRGVLAPVRLPARDHGLGVQAPGRQGSLPGVPWRHPWDWVSCGPAARTLAAADTVIRFPGQAIRQVEPPAVHGVRVGADRMQAHLSVAGRHAPGGRVKSCGNAVRAGLASGNATNASGRSRVLAPLIWRGCELPGGWLPGGAAGTDRRRVALIALRAERRRRAPAAPCAVTISAARTHPAGRIR